MKRIVAAVIVLASIGGTCEAGKRRIVFKEKKLDFKQAKLDSGVTMMRAKGFYEWGAAANNVTGVLNPGAWIRGFFR